jgi:DNA-binding response OmpR family regulator
VKTERITDEAPLPMKVVVAAATGMIRAESLEAFDEDFEAVAVPDSCTAEREVRRGVHALVIVADDLVNESPEELVQRCRLASPEGFRLPLLWLSAHGEETDLLSSCQVGADDVGHWPVEADMFRARVRSLVRVSVLEASMVRASEDEGASVEDLREALSTSTHLINNAVAGISGRAQLAALTGSSDTSGLVPVCLTEARKVSLVLNALHRLCESLRVHDSDDCRDGEHVLAGALDETG